MTKDTSWPGFGDNMRVLLWILNRCAGKVDAVESEIGYLPKPEDIDLTGLEDENVDIKGLLTIDKQVWLEDVANIEEYFAQFEINFRRKWLTNLLS